MVIASLSISEFWLRPQDYWLWPGSGARRQRRGGYQQAPGHHRVHVARGEDDNDNDTVKDSDNDRDNDNDHNNDRDNDNDDTDHAPGDELQDSQYQVWHVECGGGVIHAANRGQVTLLWWI